jgi:hypothetical protein
MASPPDARLFPMKTSRPTGLKTIQREDFWRYCNYAAGSAEWRAKKAGVPYTIDAYTIDRLLVDQSWRCAISGIELMAPAAGKREAFGPSLDRIVPALGYVPGNVRIVSNMVNCALNEWGEEAFFEMLCSVINLAKKGGWQP